MIRYCFVFTIALLSTTLHADYSQHPKAKQLAAELEASGSYSAEDVLEVLRKTHKNPALIQTERKAPERTRTWPEYRSIFMDDSRIKNGVRFLRKYYPELSRAQREFGLPPQIVAAIIGVETRYGGYTGPHRVIDSLATQGFDHPSRSPYFYSELKNYFLLCKENKLNPFEQKGSYAGAMGLSQFMPSNYRKLALDYDQNGVVNLWSEADAIGSTAHYLQQYQVQISKLGNGWQVGEAVAFPVQIDALPEKFLSNQKTASYSWAALAPYVDGLETRLLADQAVGIIKLDTGASPEYWLALPNFYVIMSYNPRAFYAMAVFQLSQALLRADLAL
ncbi:MAG: lytic murein transglycosylase B [Oceanococcus sp.]